MKAILTNLLAVSLAVLVLGLHPSSQIPGAPKDKSTPGDFPKCTDQLSTVPVPNAPHGLFAIMFPDARKQIEEARMLLHNPVVCGANFYLVWNEIDHGPNSGNRFDFSEVDKRMEPWIKAGKQVNLVTWATGYGGRAQVTPDFVFSKVHSVECENAGRVPVFWEKDFMHHYQEFMAATVQHYGNNPSVGYIRFGLGIGGETYPACMYKLKEKGFSPGVWRKYIIDMLDYEKSLNSPKQLMVGINTFGHPPDLDFANAVADRAIEHGIAIGSQGLSMEDMRNDESNSPCAANWCRNFRRAQGKVALELQSIKASNPDRSGPVGSMVDLIPFALKMKTQILEIYPVDWFVAYDSENPNYGRYHEEYQKAYEAAAKVLGGSPAK